MITVTIGATGDYASWAAFRTALGGTQSDNYTALIQNGTYNETMTVDWTMTTYTLYVEPVLGPAGAVIFDQQSVRANGLYFCKGRMVARHIEFKNPTGAVVNQFDVGGTDAVSLDVIGCTLRGGTKSASNIEAGMVTTVCKVKLVNCLFVDYTDRGVGLYAYAPGGTVDVWGCILRTDGAFTPNVGMELATGGSGTDGKVYGCLIARTGYVPTFAVMGGGYYIENCRLSHVGEGLRRQWGNSFTVKNCVVIATNGAWSGIRPMSGNNWTIYRTLIDTAGNPGCDGIYFSSNLSRAVIKNCGFVNGRWGIQVVAGLTALVCDQSYCGYYNNTSGAKTGPVGTYNNPETEVRTGNPQLDSQDNAVPQNTSDWWEMGTSTDGIPVHSNTGNPDIGYCARARVEICG